MHLKASGRIFRSLKRSKLSSDSSKNAKVWQIYIYDFFFFLHGHFWCNHLETPLVNLGTPQEAPNPMLGTTVYVTMNCASKRNCGTWCCNMIYVNWSRELLMLMEKNESCCMLLMGQINEHYQITDTTVKHCNCIINNPYINESYWVSVQVWKDFAHTQTHSK